MISLYLYPFTFIAPTKDCKIHILKSRSRSAYIKISRDRSTAGEADIRTVLIMPLTTKYRLYPPAPYTLDLQAGY